jgi:hypothetical protein
MRALFQIVQIGGTTWPPLQLVLRALSLGGGGKQLGHLADYWPLSSAKVKNECYYTSTPSVPSWHVQGKLYLFLPCISQYVLQSHILIKLYAKRLKQASCCCSVNRVKLVFLCGSVHSSVRNHFDLFNVPELHEKHLFSISILRSTEVIKNRYCA